MLLRRRHPHRFAPGAVLATPEYAEEAVSAGGDTDRGPHLHLPSVAQRVRGFQRRMPRGNALVPLPTNTRCREECTMPMAARPTVHYDLVPWASLFVDRSRLWN